MANDSVVSFYRCTYPSHTAQAHHHDERRQPYLHRATPGCPFDCRVTIYAEAPLPERHP